MALQQWVPAGSPSGEQVYIAAVQAPIPFSIRSIVVRPDTPNGAGIVMTHGMGTWAHHKEKWIALARLYAREGYTSIYPDVRHTDPLNGPGDVVDSARHLRSTENVTNVCAMGGSLGNLATLSAVQLYPSEFQMYSNIYGAMGAGPWGHLDDDRIEAMTAITLIQVGDKDDIAFEKCRILDGVMSRRGTAEHQRQVYVDQGHGFFFRPVTEGEPDRARDECLEVLNWSLLGAARPTWFLAQPIVS